VRDEETATVVASDLGRCQGHLAYLDVEWFFPQHHQRLSNNDEWHTCDQFGGRRS
jgi:hypothetical protein